MSFWNPFHLHQTDLTRLLSKENKVNGRVTTYTQKNNKYCTYFACAWALAYNVGFLLSQDEIINMADTHTIASSKQTAQKICDEINRENKTNFKVYEIDLIDWLKHGTKFAIQVTISIPDQFYLDGQDWVINGIYKQVLWKWHSMWIYRDKKKIYLINSWGKRKIDITQKIIQLLKDKAIKSKGHIIF